MSMPFCGSQFRYTGIWHPMGGAGRGGSWADGDRQAATAVQFSCTRIVNRDVH